MAPRKGIWVEIKLAQKYLFFSKDLINIKIPCSHRQLQLLTISVGTPECIWGRKPVKITTQSKSKTAWNLNSRRAKGKNRKSFVVAEYHGVSRDFETRQNYVWILSHLLNICPYECYLSLNFFTQKIRTTAHNTTRLSGELNQNLCNENICKWEYI